MLCTFDSPMTVHGILLGSKLCYSCQSKMFTWNVTCAGCVPAVSQMIALGILEGIKLCKAINQIMVPYIPSFWQLYTTCDL